MPAFKNIGSADQSKITHNRGQTFFKPKNDLKLWVIRLWVTFYWSADPMVLKACF